MSRVSNCLPAKIYGLSWRHSGLAPSIRMTRLDADKHGDQFELKLQKAEAFSAVLFDTAGHPVANARVRIEVRAVTSTEPGRTWISYDYVRGDVIAGSPLEGLFETTTDRSGLFAFHASAPETWLRLGVTPKRGTEMRVRAENEICSQGTSIAIAAGFVAAPAGKANRLVALPAAQVRGRVVTSLPGVSVAGLRVSYWGSDQPGKLPRGNNIPTQKLATGADGRFLIDGLNEGTINMIIDGKGAGESWTYRAAQDVVLKSGQTTDVVFELIRGVDVDGNFCRPYPGSESVIDARGEFHLPDGGYNTVARGKPARLMIRLRDGVEHEAAMIPSIDGVVTVKLHVRNERPAGVMGPQNVGTEELAGLVIDSQGKPLKGVEVDAGVGIPATKDARIAADGSGSTNSTRRARNENLRSSSANQATRQSVFSSHPSAFRTGSSSSTTKRTSKASS